MDAVLPVQKPSGPSSVQCLAALKKQGQRKIGHAGTLDPLASGVLIILLGQATKLSGHLMQGGKKIYRGRLRLGLATDTWDREGTPTQSRPYEHIPAAAIEAEIKAWLDLRFQEVPAYSAAKFNGQPLYKLARKGHTTPVKLKPAHIYAAELLQICLPYVDFRVTCGSGAYIRSLAHSLGVRLGCGACLHELVREYSHPFNLDTACPWQNVLNGAWQAYARPLPEALPEWPVVELDAACAARVRNGVAPCLGSNGSHALLTHAGQALALCNRKNGAWVIERGLWNT